MEIKYIDPEELLNNDVYVDEKGNIYNPVKWISKEEAREMFPERNEKDAGDRN